jgi:hypothetical protein
MKLDELFKNFHECHITYNEHKAYYQEIEEFCLDNRSHYFLVGEHRQRCIDTDTIWIAQIYPRTPVGFFCIAAPTFDELVELIDKEGRHG